MIDRSESDTVLQHAISPACFVNHRWLPAETRWTNFWTGESAEGGQQIDVAAPREIIPLFVRSGSIVPMGPALQYANEKPADPIELRIYPGADGNFNLYEDEGDSYRYEQGAYAITPMHWNDASKTLTIAQRQGNFPGMLQSRTFRLAMVGRDKAVGDSFDVKTETEAAYGGVAETIHL